MLRPHGQTGGTYADLDVDFDEAWEDEIVEAVVRLDEIGDLIDGVVSDKEVRLLLQSLGAGAASPRVGPRETT